MWDVRWQCRGCGRFVSQSAIQERDRLDPMAYYGICTDMWIDCAKCGPKQDVVCVATNQLDEVGTGA